jgi:hypothetical protein
MRVEVIVALFFFFSLVTCSGIEGNKNFAFSLQSSSNETLELFEISRSRFGYNFIKFKEKNSSKFISFYFALQNGQINTKIMNNITEEFPKLVLETFMFRSWFYNDISHHYVFNKTILKTIFKSELSVIIGANYFSQTDENPSEFEIFTIDLDNVWIEYYWDYIHNPNGIEFYHPAVFVGTLLICFVNLILLFLFINVQPLHSRGLIPIITLVTYMISIIGKSYYFLSVQFIIRFSNIIDSFIYFPLQLSQFAIIPMSFFHFMILNSIRSQKSNIILQKNQKIKFQFWILKIISRRYFALIFVLIQLGFYTIVSIVSFLIGFRVVRVFRILVGLQNTFLVIALLTDFCLILITFFKRLRDNWGKKIFFHILFDIFNEDILYFRVQYHVFGCFFYFFLIYMILRPSDIQGNWEFWIQSTSLSAFIYCFQIGFILSITIFKWIFKKEKKIINEKNMILDVIRNPQMFKLFKKFCEEGIRLFHSKFQNFQLKILNATLIF